MTLLIMMLALLTAPATDDSTTLADYFGFDGLEVLPIGDLPGPMIVTDMNGDGLEDIVVANNHRSRIEILQQRSGTTPDEPIQSPRDINEFPDHWRFKRILVPVSDVVAAIAAHDLDGDGKKDLITAGPPGRIVFLRQTQPGKFAVEMRRDIRKLAASSAAFTLADISGDGKPELVSVIGGEPAIWPIEKFTLGSVRKYPAGASIVGVVVADFDGDGMQDLAGISPDDAAPVRIWFGRKGESGVAPGPQTIFEMPPIIEFQAVGRRGSTASRIAVVERNARRIVLYDLELEAVAGKGDRDAPFTVHGFPDPGQRNRAWAMVDVNGDGRSDVIAADTQSNALAVFIQSPDGDLVASESSPSLSNIDSIAAVPASDGHPAELLVLSSEEGIVGRTPLGPGELPFPTPVPVTAGLEPVAMNVVTLGGRPHAAVIVNNKRDYTLDLLDLRSGESESIELGSLSRKPDHVQSVDVDQDGREDILILTPERPMILLLADEDGGFEKLEKRDMGQYGLVDGAQSDTTATLDVNSDGTEELLVASGNFVRALRFERGDGGGWRVVRQFNADDPDSSLVSVATLNGTLIAADADNDRILIFEPSEDGERWTQSESLRTRGFTPGPLATGNFSGDIPGIITIGEDGFAIVPLGGQRRTLQEASSWKSALDGHVPHRLAVGDVNADGYGDMVALDAGEQMFEIFTFDQSGEMLYATGFQIFETQLFHSGDTREYQPRQVVIADVTGDGSHDVIMLCHDRVLLYPQPPMKPVADAQ